MIWKDIIGWEGYYKISNAGLVINVQTNKIKKPCENSTGYMRITLENKNHIPNQKRFFVHRLVAMHFIPNPLNLPEVNHKDTDIKNNISDNLEWSTKKENELHSHKYGNKEYKPFKVIYKNKINEEYDVKQDFADKLGISRVLIKYWLHGKSKTYINYNIENIYYI